MRIFVLTRSRIHKQITRREFCLDKMAYNVTYVVPESQQDAYVRAWPGSNTVTVPDEFKIHQIRQHVMETFRAPDPLHVVMDDDLVFLRRKSPKDIHQRKGLLADALEVFPRMESWMVRGGYLHGSLSQRGGNNHVEDAFKEVGRSVDCHFYQAHRLYELGIRIDAIVLRSDFHMTLSLLELGYPNIIDYEFMSGQKDGEPGGCQDYRTHDMLDSQAHELVKLHPGFVTVVTKERIGGFGTSTDVRIAWKKAYEHGLAIRRSRGETV
jgi:hypothetical protein